MTKASADSSVMILQAGWTFNVTSMLWRAFKACREGACAVKRSFVLYMPGSRDWLCTRTWTSATLPGSTFPAVGCRLSQLFWAEGEAASPLPALLADQYKGCPPGLATVST